MLKEDGEQIIKKDLGEENANTQIDMIQLGKRVSANEKRISSLTKKKSLGAKLRGKIPKRGTWPTI